MSYLNLDLNYFEHPKTVRLTGLLGRGAEVLPIKLWTYCGKVHAEDGRLSNYSARELESAIGWWGKEGEAAAAMVKVAFVRSLEGSDAGFEVVDWLDHQGHLAAFKRRALAGAKARWDKISNAASIAKSEVKQCPVPTNLLNQPITSTPRPAARDPLEGFEAWYEKYPLKKARGAAERAWKALRSDETLRSKMLFALENQKGHRQTSERSGVFVPSWAYPATWLNQKRWEDVLTSVPVTAGPGIHAVAGKYEGIGERHDPA